MQRFQQFWIFIAVVSQIFDQPKITVDLDIALKYI